MLKIGYDKRFAAGVVAAGGTLASLIPPSAILVIYAIIVEQDVGKLLLAGFIPGVVSAFIYAGLIIILALTLKNFGPPVGGFTWKERLVVLPPALPIVAVVVIIIFFVYNPFGGDAWGTPTEGGAIGAFIVFCMAVYRGMRWPQLRDALLETAKLSVMIFTIIWGVLIYVRFLGFADLPSAFSDWITSLDQSPMLTLVLILLAYAVLGMFMDAIGMLLLTLPVVFPAVMALNGGIAVSAEESAFGMSGPLCAIWFGILVVKMAEFCLITPPIGLNCVRRGRCPGRHLRSGRLQGRHALLHRRRDHHRHPRRLPGHCPLAAVPGLLMADDPRPGETRADLPDPADAQLRFIGRVRTPFATRDDCPRQGDPEHGPLCRLEVDAVWADALDGLEGYEIAEVLYWLDQSRRDLVTQSPKSDGRTTGTFALRSPVRPNPIGLARVRITGRDGNALLVHGLDCIDGTPLLDIKPDRCAFTVQAPPKGA